MEAFRPSRGGPTNVPDYEHERAGNDGSRIAQWGEKG